MGINMSKEKKSEKTAMELDLFNERRPKLPHYVNDCILWTIGHLAKVYKLLAGLTIIYASIMIVYGSFMLTVWSLGINLEAMDVF